MDPSMDPAALQAELELLRQDNAALLEALRLAQRGGVDLQGHLSKFNPDAAEQGIFAQDWELRYFVLSGSLLKYYTSERDVGRRYRGLLSLEDCIVEVEEPTSVKGPFIFQIQDPEGETLIRLSADTLAVAKTWIKTLHAVGLRVRGFKHLTAVTQPGWHPRPQGLGQGPAPSAGFSNSLASFGRAFSSKWSSEPLQNPANSFDSNLSLRVERPPHMLHHPQGAVVYEEEAQEGAASEASAAAAAAAAVGVAAEASGRKDTRTAVSLQQQQQQQGRRQVGDSAAGPSHPVSLGHGVTDSEDDMLSLDEEDPVQSNRLTRLRHKCRWLRCKLHHRVKCGNWGAAGPPGAAFNSAPGAVGAAAGAAAAGSSSAAAASQPGMAAAGGGGVGAAAAPAAVPGGLHRWGSSRHRRTISDPSLQKQVSWRWERLDLGDELPVAEHSDLDDSSSVSSSSSSTHGDSAYDPAHDLAPQQAVYLQQPVSLQQEPVSWQDIADLQQQQQQGMLSGPLDNIQEEEPPKRPQRISAFGEATEAATIAAAGGVSAAGTDPTAAEAAAAAGGGVSGPPTPPPIPTGPSVRGSGFKGGAALGSLKPQGTAITKPKKGPMVGYSPVHVASKDSILTEHDQHGVLRHEGFLNLCVVVLLATNLRMIIGNLMTYGLRMQVNRALLQSVLPLPLSWDDGTTLAAIPGSCIVFALGALLIEWLGLRLLLAQEKLLRGLQKKGVPTVDLAAQGAAISSRHEGLLLLLNLLNAGGSLVLPCCLVLSNQASLVPAFILTVVAIVMSMKLATYAHCNTTLRQEARSRAVAAAAAGWPIPSNTLAPPGALFWRQNKASLASRSGSMLVPAGLTTAATHTAAAAIAASVPGSNDITVLRSSATEPGPFGKTPTPGLSRSSSLSRRQGVEGAGFMVVRDVVYPDNLNPADMAYFLAAPTLTYQLNFPRLRQRRWRLLSRWMLLAVMTAMVMSFMQVHPCINEAYLTDRLVSRMPMLTAQVQFLMPCMQSSLVPLREMNMLRFMERLLRLSVPNTAVWLAMFYLVFHLWLNILGELLMFGDRMFYKDWWNAATLADYWKLWNVPVHKWMLRTIFFPLVRRGAPRLASLLFVFLVSAVMHELAVGVPLRMLRGWAFWGMMLQVPLITLTEVLRNKLKADTFGNMVFWVSFCVFGQPMCLVLYYHDWLLANLGEQGWAAAAAQGDDAAVRMASGAFNATLSSVAGSLTY